LRVLQIHNSYQFAGGEDAVVAAEAELLKSHRETVETYIVSNHDIRGVTERISTALSVGYSHRAREAVRARIASMRPDIVHVHNTFPLLTPSVYDACADAGVPVVQTLHNYRLGCINGLLLRNGDVCEKCWTGSPYWGALHACYRDSTFGSLAASVAYARHRRADTWNTKVTRFIALCEFAAKKFEAFGIDPEKIVVKPNFAEDPGRVTDGGDRHGALFVGRLSPEKGILDLIEAWREISYPLTVIGDGPLLDEIRRRATSQVRLVGRYSGPEILREMKKAAFLVVPSRCYESSPPRVIIEAFACGLPVVGSAIGAIEEVVEKSNAGRLFAPGSADQLRATITTLISDGSALGGLSTRAREYYRQHFTPERSYEQLREIYEQCIRTAVSKSNPVGV